MSITNKLIGTVSGREPRFPMGESCASRRRQPLAKAGATLAALVAVVAVTLGVAAGPAGAVQFLNHSGTLGAVYGEGAMVCNPFVSNGFATRYVELGSPLVGEVLRQNQPNVHVIGGDQVIRWRPQLDKWVNGQWRAIWLGPWYMETSYGDPSSFGDPLLDVYTVPGGGRGYYRMSGTIWWIADQDQAGGWVNYVLNEGDYFKDGWVTRYGASATPVSTPYCFVP